MQLTTLREFAQRRLAKQGEINLWDGLRIFPLCALMGYADRDLFGP